MKCKNLSARSILLISCISLSSSALASVGSVSTGSQSNTCGTMKIINVSDSDLTYVSNKTDSGAFINYPQVIPANSTANIGLVCENYGEQGRGFSGDIAYKSVRGSFRIDFEPKVSFLSDFSCNFNVLDQSWYGVKILGSGSNYCNYQIFGSQ